MFYLMDVTCVSSHLDKTDWTPHKLDTTDSHVHWAVWARIHKTDADPCNSNCKKEQKALKRGQFLGHVSVFFLQSVCCLACWFYPVAFSHWTSQFTCKFPSAMRFALSPKVIHPIPLEIHSDIGNCWVDSSKEIHSSVLNRTFMMLGLLCWILLLWHLKQKPVFLGKRTKATNCHSRLSNPTPIPKLAPPKAVSSLFFFPFKAKPYFCSLGGGCYWAFIIHPNVIAKAKVVVRKLGVPNRCLCNNAMKTKLVLRTSNCSCTRQPVKYILNVHMQLNTPFVMFLSCLFAGEIERCLKKVSEGVETFEDIWQKVSASYVFARSIVFLVSLISRDLLKDWSMANQLLY